MTDAPDTPGDREGLPDWWLENERIKSEFDLPTYEPPRFSDETFVHRVTDPLEERYDCEIGFVGVDPRYPDDWVVRIDREPAMTIGRRRDRNGNTVYSMTSESFREAIVAELE